MWRVERVCLAMPTLVYTQLQATTFYNEAMWGETQSYDSIVWLKVGRVPPAPQYAYNYTAAWPGDLGDSGLDLYRVHVHVNAY